MNPPSLLYLHKSQSQEIPNLSSSERPPDTEKVAQASRLLDLAAICLTQFLEDMGSAETILLSLTSASADREIMQRQVQQMWLRVATALNESSKNRPQMVHP